MNLMLIIISVVIIQDSSTQVLKRQTRGALDHNNDETPETKTLRELIKLTHPGYICNPASPVHKFNAEILRLQQSNIKNKRNDKNMNWKVVFGKGYSDSVEHIQRKLASKKITHKNVKKFEAQSNEIDAIYKSRVDKMVRLDARYNKLCDKKNSGKMLKQREQREMQDFTENEAGHIHAADVWYNMNEAIKRKIAEHKASNYTTEATNAVLHDLQKQLAALTELFDKLAIFAQTEIGKIANSIENMNSTMISSENVTAELEKNKNETKNEITKLQIKLNTVQDLISKNVSDELKINNMKLLILVAGSNKMLVELTGTQVELANMKSKLDKQEPRGLIDLKEEFQKRTIMTQHAIAEIKYELSAINKTHANNLVPIGFTYTQLPNQSPPSEIWPGTQWKDLSGSLAGLFFRVEGENSLPFGQIQEANYSRISQIKTKIYNGVNVKKWETVDLVEGHWSGNFINIGHMYDIRFYTTEGENRPRNTAVSVWKRVA